MKYSDKKMDNGWTNEQTNKWIEILYNYINMITKNVKSLIIEC